MPFIHKKTLAVLQRPVSGQARNNARTANAGAMPRERSGSDRSERFQLRVILRNHRKRTRGGGDANHPARDPGC